MGGTVKQKQQQNHHLRKDNSLSYPSGGLNAFCWRQIFAIDSVVVNAQKLFSSHGGYLTNTMHHHREKNLIKFSPYDETTKWLVTHR